MTRHDGINTKRRRKFKISYVIIGLLVVIIAGFIIFRLNSKSKIESKLAAIRAEGYPVTLAELDAWYAIPESSKNAADTITEAFSHYYEWDKEYLKGLPVVGEARLPIRTEPMSAEMKALVAEYVSDNKEALDLLAKGAAIEHSRYPVDLTKGVGLLSYLGDIRQGMKKLQLEAVLYAENDEPQLAVDSITAMLGVTRSLAKEPLLISQLTRIACVSLAASAIERVVNRTELTDKQLTELGQILENADDRASMSLAFVGERCIMGSALCYCSSRDISMCGSVPSTAPLLIGLCKVVGLANMDALLYIDFMTKYMAVTQLEPHHRMEASKAIEADFEKISKIHILLHIFRPTFSRIIELDLTCAALMQTARVGIAVERYRLATGNLPDTIDDIVPTYLDAVPKDPFDGKNLRYKKLDIGFVVYSIGEDENDDGGKEMMSSQKRKNESYTYDITFIVQR